ncbi:MAG TPA: YfhO family protein [Thermoanaerobaculia bacterium]
MIGEPTMVMQTWAIIGAYGLYRIVVARLAVGQVAPRRPGKRAIWEPIVLLIACGVLAALIAAVQIVPAIDFARDTVRSHGLPFRFTSNWSFPLERLEELALPSLFWHVKGSDGQPAIRTMYRDRIVPFLRTVYCGAFFVILAIAGIFAAVRGRSWFLAAFGASVIVAMGDHTPLLQLLYDVGLVNAIRYPEKFILAGTLALAIWSAMVIQELLDGDASIARSASVIAAIWTGVMLIAALSANDKTYFWTNVARAAAVLIVLLLLRARHAPWSVAILIAAALGELWLGTRAATPRMPRAFFDAPPLESELKPFGGARIFHDAQWSAWMGSELSNEYFYNVESDRFWWVDRNGEFLNMPAAWGDHPVVLEQDVDYTSLKNTEDFRQAFNTAHGKRDPNAGDPYLRMANASVRLSFRTLDEQVNRALNSGPAQVTPVTATPIETNPRYAFAARMERIDSNEELGPAIESHPPEGVVAFVNAEEFQPAGGEVVSAKETRNTVKLDVRATGKAFLVASVTSHKYWSATIDGQKVPIIPTNVAFQGVVVPVGTHTIEFRYRNPLVGVSGAVSLLTLLVLGGASWPQRKRAG